MRSRETTVMTLRRGDIQVHVDNPALISLINMKPPYTLNSFTEQYKGYDMFFDMRTDGCAFTFVSTGERCFFQHHHLGVAAILCFLGKIEQLKLYLSQRSYMEHADQAEAAIFAAAAGGAVDMLKELKSHIAAKHFSKVIWSPSFIAIVDIAETNAQVAALDELLSWGSIMPIIALYRRRQTMRAVIRVMSEIVYEIVDAAGYQCQRRAAEQFMNSVLGRVGKAVDKNQRQRHEAEQLLDDIVEDSLEDSLDDLMDRGSDFKPLGRWHGSIFSTASDWKKLSDGKDPQDLHRTEEGLLPNISPT
ncbi:MAG: hypothetical protein P1U34_00990 [Coxiellaceae bacterium]|nr:hypothetical protein [Coxiellaceae bacterium]